MTNTNDNMIEWRDGVLPVSTRFDDPYFSRADGRAETDHVFINSNHLPTRWPDMALCTIAELGFGTGLNFLQTVLRWRDYKPPNAKLHFISFEQYPMRSDEMRKALSHWPELTSLTDRLVDIWAAEDEICNIQFADDITLSVHIGDANTILPDLELLVDAWFLDGFSPAKNPELWNEQLMLEVGRNTRLDGTFATYTAAGFVKRGLQSAGFDVQKVSGFGTKRDMLVGQLSRDIDVAYEP